MINIRMLSNLIKCLNIINVVFLLMIIQNRQIRNHFFGSFGAASSSDSDSDSESDSFSLSASSPESSDSDSSASALAGGDFFLVSVVFTAFVSGVSSSSDSLSESTSVCTLLFTGGVCASLPAATAGVGLIVGAEI